MCVLYLQVGELCADLHRCYITSDGQSLRDSCSFGYCHSGVDVHADFWAWIQADGTVLNNDFTCELLS